MRIDLTSSGLQQPENTRPQKAGLREAAAAGPQEAAGTAGDSAEFSSSFDPGRVQALSAQVLAAPEIRQAKVLSLQQSISAGAYSVDASRVAGAILSAYGSPLAG